MYSIQEAQKMCIHNYMSGLISAFRAMDVSKEDSITKAIDFAKNQISEESEEDAAYLNEFLEGWIETRVNAKKQCSGKN